MTAIAPTNSLVADLFTQHHKTLLALIFKRVHCLDTAEDLSQETFLRLVRKDLLTHDENLAGYLFRIAEHLVIDYQRREHKLNQHTEDLETLSISLPCPKPLPDEITALREECARLLKAIQSLPIKSRQVFLLRKINDLSYNEIAQALAISEKTVQRHLVNAMLHCHHYMQSPDAQN